MNRFDLIKHTLQWVWGACILWNQYAKQFDTNSREFQDFVHRTHGVVIDYLRGRIRLDGACSDFECCTALDAKAVFGKLMIESEWREM